VTVDSRRRGRPSGAVYFPHNSLKEALKIPAAIWEKGAGNPFALQDVANYTRTSTGSSYSPTSSSFAELVRSANRYGLIEGSWQQKVTSTINLSPLGRSIVAPTATDDVNTSLRTALETPEVFRKFLESLHGRVIPPEQVCINTLIQDYHVRREDARICFAVLMQNIDELNLSKDSQGKLYLRLDNLSATTEAIIPTEEGETSPIEEDHLLTPAASELYTQESQSTFEQKQMLKQIFIAHGKNKKPLEQVVKILQEYGIPHTVAVEEANRGRPVSVKVAEEMKKCTAGIFIFTADEKTTDNEGKEVRRPSDNVVYELGAGSVLYGNKIVIFREEGVDFASDFKEIGYIPFETDKLDAKGLDLMKELQSLGIIKFTVT
jgi:predicted nucleotide-binding protein